VIVDGTLIHTDRIATPGPTAGVDLWWSGKHKHHGGNVQVVSTPDGWPLWTSDVRPGREHDITAARTDPDLITLITAWVTDGRPGLADLGYEGAPEVFTVPHKKPKNTDLTADQQTFNAANSLLKTTYKVLRRYRGCPWRIGTIVAAALVLLHDENKRTT
jgi:DDE superfamily endonuclease